MTVTIERLPDSMVSMRIEVAEERFRDALEAAVQRLATQIEGGGVKPGEAPPDVVEQLFGRPRVVQEALDELVPAVYDEAIASEALDPVEPPEVEVSSMNPLVVSVSVAVQPTVSLGDYRSLRARLVAPEHSADEVNEELTKLRSRFAVLEPVDRAVEWGDTVRADVTIEMDVDGAARRHEVPQAEFRLWPGTVVSFPGFAEQVTGLTRGSERTCAVTLPGDYESAELAGTEARYTIAVREVKEERLPALDDDFARSVDAQLETVEQLRASVDAALRRGAEQTVLAEYHDRIVGKLLGSVEIDYPAVFVEREIDRLMAEQSENASLTEQGLEGWLASIGRTVDEARGELAAEADLNVRRAITLDKLAIEEGIELPAGRVDERLAEVAQAMAGGGAGAEVVDRLRASLDTEEGRRQIEAQLEMQAALDRLTEICSGAG